jgi:hypothetical protein
MDLSIATDDELRDELHGAQEFLAALMSGAPLGNPFEGREEAKKAELHQTKRRFIQNLISAMPRGPKAERRPADVIGNAVKIMRIATGEEPEDYGPQTGKGKAAQGPGPQRWQEAR